MGAETGLQTVTRQKRQAEYAREQHRLAQEKVEQLEAIMADCAGCQAELAGLDRTDADDLDLAEKMIERRNAPISGG